MRRQDDIAASLSRLRAAAALAHRPIVLMEVCGTHTMSAARCGLHSLLPPNVTLLSGPGCPVCVTTQAEIDLIITLAQTPGLTLCTYGDMIRVPGTQGEGGRGGSLERARGRGADVRVIYSAMDAVKLAAASPDRQVVLIGIGFETTAPATAACILEAARLGLANFTVLSCHKRAVPAVAALFETTEVRVDGLVCPGHVAVITGSEAFRPIVERYGKPCAVAGFQEGQMAEALAWLAECVTEGRAELANLYPQAVTPQGNPLAMRLLDQVFETRETAWRGLGAIAGSGLFLRDQWRAFDAHARFGVTLPPGGAKEPAGCRCGEVITGRATPAACPLFGQTCTPQDPVGPCMVSSEGTCHAWYRYRKVGQGKVGIAGEVSHA
ncbi:MAG: hydrogenase formation protein HypD [Phycisphaerae bacterium]